MKTLQGTSHNILEPLIGKVSRRALSFGRHKTVLVAEKFHWSLRHKAFLTSSTSLPRLYGKMPYIGGISPESLSELRTGDIIKIYPNGNVVRVWEEGSLQNVIFVTDKCNCRCIMCPQPANSNLSSSFWKENKEILSMVSSKTNSICFSGGEPTLEMEQLKDLLVFCKKRLPNAHLAILTNGIALADFSKTKQLIEQRNKFLLFCISLNGDIDDVHDEIVGAEAAFGHVMRGLYNLARFRCRIELRFVIMRQNYERLPYYAEFVYRNLPFVSHIAFMGLEYTGEAAKNLESIRIDPVDYAGLLREAILQLHRREMNISIYNVPRCLLPRDIWEFSRDSISTWKKTYLDLCSSCEERVNCCGLFETSVHVSPNISPILGQ
ncbi:His-Xaa-Ser system radical SAM maturase HxsC [Acetomicrobium sp. S15 = DSM 107314]|uniref:His-Xaa-Ser system radical SAM maturase HxsC n=1 Tax=Acetomicrobium sp. S15 = DSM 107314 TaxID=2529858 RepID=UPI0018E0D7DB|nr:His-Xaa-Ser system radical SAM maturase HxsC [Acetomicrobium sp. S15 = DSM 107314]